ncbi:TetR/AcrR family transcriptional regulator [Microbacterium sp. MPKO10]|uniref:TetR/AcrR family transcriptional regulator n=1 Tax=Microbacterium sp. MPKO10 TaxID=2989818 RepID=UPI002236A9E9|nr:TetR family transcriptional regulator [Microbacterium sp. MPKO10]MCW4457679.1 TetR family transcriptional regulator [Microbacterium sp. MPKO10]
MGRTDGRLERGMQTRERILDAAIEIIAEGGAGAATQRMVAARAEMSLASITYHFPSARELIIAAMRRASGLAVTWLAERQSHMLTDRDSLEDFTVDYISAHRSGAFPAGIVALELSLAAVHEPDLRSADEDNMAALESFLFKLLSDNDKARAAARAFTGLLLIELGSNREPGSEETRRTIRTLHDVFGFESPPQRSE